MFSLWVELTTTLTNCDIPGRRSLLGNVNGQMFRRASPIGKMMNVCNAFILWKNAFLKQR
jgi:hypothetical protein